MNPLRHRLELEIHRLSRHLQARVHELRYLFWECTLRCNLRCGHCGSACGDGTCRDPSPETFLKVLDEVATRYMPSKVTVVITGGEPLLRSDLEACGSAIHERGFPWGMVTNGFFLGPQRLDSLLQAGLGAVTVSLDGLEGSHNRLRHHPEAFARAASTIARCTAVPGLAFDVATCVHGDNLKELPELKRFLIGLGVRRWRLFSIFPRGRAKEDARLQLLPGQLRAMMEFLKSTRAEGGIRASYGCEGYLGDYEGQVRDGFFHCQAGTSVASVLSDGSFSACPSLRGDFIQGNVTHERFLEVWDRRYRGMRDRRWARSHEPCSHCRDWRFCEGNGLHLWEDGKRLLRCHLQELARQE